MDCHAKAVTYCFFWQNRQESAILIIFRTNYHVVAQKLQNVWSTKEYAPQFVSTYYILVHVLQICSLLHVYSIEEGLGMQGVVAFLVFGESWVFNANSGETHNELAYDAGLFTDRVAGMRSPSVCRR